MAEADEKTDIPLPYEPPTKASPRDPTRHVGDVIPSGNLWPDLPRRELDDLLNIELVIEDFSFLQGRYGQFAVFLARMPGTAQQFTSACGGEVVCRKLEALKDGRHLPVLGTISYNERYYDLA